MRVLHVGEVIRGGVATYLKTILPTQAAALGDENVFVFIPERYAADLGGTPATVLTTRSSGRGTMQLLRFWRDLQRAIAQVEPDLIHAHSSFPGFFTRLSALTFRPSSRPKIVYCAHGWSFLSGAAPWKQRVYTLMERAVAPLTDGLVNISRHEAEEAAARGVRGREELLAYNGLPDEELEPGAANGDPADGGLTLLFVGRFDRQKGFDILVDAIRKLNRPDVRVLVAGAAVVPGQEVALTHGGIGQHRFEFFGWQNQIGLARLYAQADAVVVPSRWEGFGLVAVEAMRAGRAVIASRCGALPEIVVPGLTGLLFDPESPEQLTNVLEGLEKESLRAMGRQGRQRYEMLFTATRLNAELLALYRRLVPERPAAV